MYEVLYLLNIIMLLPYIFENVMLIIVCAY